MPGPKGGSRRCRNGVRAPPWVRQRRRVTGGGDRLGDGSGPRQLPAGVHTRGTDQRGVDPRRVRKRGARQSRHVREASGGFQMNKGGIALWGFAGTVVLTTLLAGSQALGLTRMNIPFMLGTMVTPDRDRAKLVGFGMHLINGWLFATVYAAAFQSWRRATWWLGALIGLVHGLFVLVAAMPLLPTMHPRMASEQHGPT